MTSVLTAGQQLDHWARVGRAVSSQHSAARHKIEAALAGDTARTSAVIGAWTDANRAFLR